MSLSMYQASAPVFAHVLGNLSILDKGAAFAQFSQDRAFGADQFAARPDMFPLSRQVQIASDMVIRGSARLAGVDIPSNPDVETTFPELRRGSPSPSNL